jgi:hypothetical protein
MRFALLMMKHFKSEFWNYLEIFPIPSRLSTFGCDKTDIFRKSSGHANDLVRRMRGTNIMRLASVSARIDQYSSQRSLLPVRSPCAFAFLIPLSRRFER